MKCYYVKLVRMRIGVLTMEPVEKETRLFSTLESAQTWLRENGFIYGQRNFFNYPEGGKEWFHKDDISLEYVDVTIKEINADDMAESKFKNLRELHREWLPKFLEEATEMDAVCKNIEKGIQQGREEKKGEKKEKYMVQFPHIGS